MVFVVVALVGWPRKQEQDQVFTTIDNGRLGKVQWTPGVNVRETVVNSQFGNRVRVEFMAGTDADGVWQQIKDYLAANKPLPGSRWRRLDCNWDGANTGCTLVQEQVVLADGTVVTQP